jgi:DEAD/DEAH box helicase domain-containing protein
VAEDSPSGSALLQSGIPPSRAATADSQNPAGAAQAKAFEPNIYLYDKYPGGIGFSEPLYRMSGDLLENTRRLISNCPCPTGCPSCVGPAGEVGEKGKEVALSLLRLILGSPGSN